MAGFRAGETGSTLSFSYSKSKDSTTQRKNGLQELVDRGRGPFGRRTGRYLTLAERKPSNFPFLPRRRKTLSRVSLKCGATPTDNC